MTNRKSLQQLKHRVLLVYKALYYGYFGCAPALRWKRCLPGIDDHQILLVKSDGNCLAYHPIPKTGCTTVKFLLLDAIGSPLPADAEEVHSMTECSVTPENSDNHLVAARMFENGFKLLPDLPEFKHAFHFAFVRNPWSRLASCYTNKVLDKRPRRFSEFKYLYPGIRFERMTFPDFVRFVCRVPDDLCEPHFRPQYRFIDRGAIDFIGQTEHFADDLAVIIRRAGLDQRLLKWAQTKINLTQTSPRGYVDLYTAKTRDLVARKYAKDIDWFGYRFGD